MALALNNLTKVDMPLNKETKPNFFRSWINFEIFKQTIVESYKKTLLIKKRGRFMHKPFSRNIYLLIGI